MTTDRNGTPWRLGDRVVMGAGRLRGIVGTVCAVAANGLVCVKAAPRKTYWAEPLMLDRVDTERLDRWREPATR